MPIISWAHIRIWTSFYRTISTSEHSRWNWHQIWATLVILWRTSFSMLSAGNSPGVKVSTLSLIDIIRADLLIILRRWMGNHQTLSCDTQTGSKDQCQSFPRASPLSQWGMAWNIHWIYWERYIHAVYHGIRRLADTLPSLCLTGYSEVVPSVDPSCTELATSDDLEGTSLYKESEEAAGAWNPSSSCRP